MDILYNWGTTDLMETGFSLKNRPKRAENSPVSQLLNLNLRRLGLIRSCRVKHVPIPQKFVFLVEPVSSVRPSSVTDNLREMYHNISGYDMLLLKKNLPWNWHIFHPKSPHDELPLDRQKKFIRLI